MSALSISAHGLPAMSKFLMLLSTWDLVRPIAFARSSTYLFMASARVASRRFWSPARKSSNAPGFAKSFSRFSSQAAALEGTVLGENRPSCSPDRDLGEPGSGAVFPLSLDDGAHGVTP